MSDRVEKIEARLDKATPGPWSEEYLYGLLRYGYKQDFAYFSGIKVEEGANKPDHEDADFIAHAPEDIAWLLEKLALEKCICQKFLSEYKSEWVEMQKRCEALERAILSGKGACHVCATPTKECNQCDSRRHTKWEFNEKFDAEEAGE